MHRSRRGNPCSEREIRLCYRDLKMKETVRNKSDKNPACFTAKRIIPSSSSFQSSSKSSGEAEKSEHKSKQRSLTSSKHSPSRADITLRRKLRKDRTSSVDLSELPSGNALHYEDFTSRAHNKIPVKVVGDNDTLELIADNLIPTSFSRNPSTIEVIYYPRNNTLPRRMLKSRQTIPESKVKTEPLESMESQAQSRQGDKEEDCEEDTEIDSNASTTIQTSEETICQDDLDTIESVDQELSEQQPIGTNEEKREEPGKVHSELLDIRKFIAESSKTQSDDTVAPKSSLDLFKKSSEESRKRPYSDISASSNPELSHSKHTKEENKDEGKIKRHKKTKGKEENMYFPRLTIRLTEINKKLLNRHDLNLLNGHKDKKKSDKSRIRTLKNEVEYLKKELRALRSDKEEKLVLSKTKEEISNRKMSTLQASLAKIMRQKVEISLENKKLKSSNETLTTKVAHLESESTKVSKDYRSKEAALQKSQEELAEKIHENLGLSCKVKSLRDEKEKYEKDLADLNDKYHNAIISLNTLRVKSPLGPDLSQKKVVICDQACQVNAQTLNRVEENKMIQNLKMEHVLEKVRLNQRIAELEAESRVKQTSLQSKLQETEKAKDILVKELNVCNKSIEDLKSQKNNLETRVDELQKHLKSSKDEIKRERETFEKKISDLQEEGKQKEEKLKDIIEKSEKELKNETERNIREMKKLHEEMNNLKEFKKVYKDQFEKNNSIIKGKEEEIKKLSSDLKTTIEEKLQVVKEKEQLQSKYDSMSEGSRKTIDMVHKSYLKRVNEKDAMIKKAAEDFKQLREKYEKNLKQLSIEKNKYLQMKEVRQNVPIQTNIDRTNTSAGIQSEVSISKDPPQNSIKLSASTCQNPHSSTFRAVELSPAAVNQPTNSGVPKSNQSRSQISIKPTATSQGSATTRQKQNPQQSVSSSSSTAGNFTTSSNPITQTNLLASHQSKEPNQPQSKDEYIKSTIEQINDQLKRYPLEDQEECSKIYESLKKMFVEIATEEKAIDENGELSKEITNEADLYEIFDTFFHNFISMKPLFAHAEKAKKAILTKLAKLILVKIFLEVLKIAPRQILQEILC